MTAGDRRHPPQAEIMALMIELGGITQAAREELKAFREEREAWRDDIAELTATLKSSDADRKQLREEIKPLSEALHQARDLRPTRDLRSVLKGVLRDHVGIPDKSLADVVFPSSGSAPPLDGLIG